MNLDRVLPLRRILLHIGVTLLRVICAAIPAAVQNHMAVIEAVIIKFAPLAAEYSSTLLGWLISAAVKAALSSQTKKWLEGRAKQRAYLAALDRALSQTGKEFPNLARALVDKEFLSSTISNETKLFLTRVSTPSAERIAQDYQRRFAPDGEAEIASAAKRFLELFEQECKRENALQDLLTHRQTDETNRIVKEIAAQQGLPDESTDFPQIDEGSIVAAFRVASQELLNWPQTLDQSEWIDRPELGQLLARISENEDSVSLLLGEPGSGKSALLARLGGEARRSGWVVLAIKADQLPEAMASLDGLRSFYDLPGPVVDCLRVAATERKVVVLLDQLDALGELVDLQTQRLAVLLRLLNSIKQTKNIHIVCSCRTFERTYDRRLSMVQAEEIHLALPPWELVSGILKERGIVADTWPDSFRSLLRVPQCLKLFLRHFSGLGEARIFETYQTMLEELWTKVLFTSRHSTAQELAYNIATEMAEREVLFVPTARFDQLRQDLDYLVSSGVLQKDQSGKQLSFSHQTLFDFARARAFIAREQSLSRYVLERQTGLFIRPKLWSALIYLRATDETVYRSELLAVWGATGLRAHIKTLLIEFMGQQEKPLECEIVALRPMFADAYYSANAFSAVAGRKAWFGVISADVLPDAMRGSTQAAQSTLSVLQAAWSLARERVLQLLKTHWIPDTTKHLHAWYVLRTLSEWDREALDVALEVVRTSDFGNGEVQYVASIISCGPQ
jgi:hypothetical protein